MVSETYSILIVDDNPEDRDTVRRYLQRDPDRSYQIREAETGTDGLEQVRRGRIDAILLDYHLPDTNGIEFLTEVIRTHGQDAFAVIMFTGTGSEAIAVQSMKIGAHDYLVKGQVTAEGIRRAIHNSILRVRMLRQLADQRMELERKNHELRLADERKNEFMAVLAHELRNPLAATRNAVELLKLGGHEPERFQQALGILERQMRHQSHLLDDLLDISRITRGKILLQRDVVDLAHLALDAIQDNRAALEQAGLEVDAHLPGEPVWVDGDPVRLSQVLDNLLQNAAKFTDSGGRVGILLSTEEDEAVLRVRDDGIGIDSAMLPEIFEPFQQADRSLDRSRGGLGLGLALVRGLAELHGGSVSVESAGHGQGTEFVLRLPLRDEPRAGSASTELDPPGRREVGLRVLVVEDNRDAAETLRDLLELYGHRVELAMSGPEGVSRALEFRPQVVLCDLGLPEMDGYEVAAALRQHDTLRDTVLIAVSGYGQEEDRQRSRAAGFDHHLTKPVDPPVLQALLAELSRR